MAGNSVEDYVDLWQRINHLRGTCGAKKNRNGMDDYERKTMQAVYDSLNQAAKWMLELAHHMETDYIGESE